MPYEIDLTGKYAQITGANRGIGKFIATTLAQAGANLILCARKPDSLNDLKKQLIEEYHVDVHVYYFDVADYDAVKEVYRNIFKITKTLEILINNAGVLQDALIGMIKKSDIDQVFSTNVFGLIYCTQYAARMMQKAQQGSIINLSSIIGTNGNEGQVVYGGSKAAVIGITTSLAKELAPYNIRVNAIAPGFIDTDMTRSIPEDKFNERMASIKMRRIGNPQDIANTVLYFASDLSTYVTGQIVGVDGGMLI